MSRSASCAAILVAAFAVVLGVRARRAAATSRRSPGCKADKDCKNGLRSASRTSASSAPTTRSARRARRAARTPASPQPECTKDDQCPPARSARPASARPCASDGECGPGGIVRGGRLQAREEVREGRGLRRRRGLRRTGSAARPAPASNRSTPPATLATVYFGFDDSTHPGERARPARRATRSASRRPRASRSSSSATPTRRAPRSTTSRSPSAARSRSPTTWRASARDPARLQVVPKGETEPTGLGDDKDRRVRVPVEVMRLTKLADRARPARSGGLLLGHDQERGRRRCARTSRRSSEQLDREGEGARRRRSTQLKKVLEDATKLLKRNSADLGADVEQLRTDVRDGERPRHRGQQPRSTSSSSRSTRTARRTTPRSTRSSSGSPRSRAASRRANSSAPTTCGSSARRRSRPARYNDAIDIFKRLDADLPDARPRRRRAVLPRPGLHEPQGLGQGDRRRTSSSSTSTPTARSPTTASTSPRSPRSSSRTAPRRAPTSASSSRSIRSRTCAKQAAELDAAIKKDLKNKSKCAS